MASDDSVTHHSRGRSSQIENLLNFWKEVEVGESKAAAVEPVAFGRHIDLGSGEIVADYKHENATTQAVDDDDYGGDTSVVQQLKAVSNESELAVATLILDNMSDDCDEASVKAAIKAAAAFTASTDTNCPRKKRLLQLEACTTIAAAVVENSHKKSICVNGLTSLYQLSQHTDSVAQLTHPKVLNALMSVLETREESAKIQSVGYRLIVTVATGNAKVQTMLAALGAVDIIFNGLRKHPDHSGVQMWGFAAISALITQPRNVQNRANVVESGGIELIVEAMTAHKKWAGVQHFGLFTLRALSSKSLKIQNEIHDRGGLTAICECILSAHPNIQKEALLAMVGVTDHNERNQAKAVELGILDSLLAIMRSCEIIENLGVSVLAAGTLAQNNMDIQNIQLTCGIVELVFKALRKYTDEPSILQWCCYFFSAYSLENMEAQQYFTDNGAMEAVLNAMVTHMKYAPLVAEALGSLAAFASCNLAKKEELDELGGIRSCVKCMKLHPKSADVQARGCAALGVLSRGSRAHQDKISDQGGIAVIYKALVKMPDELDVQRSGFAALMLLASGHEDNQKAMRVLDIEDLAREAVDKYDDDMIIREAKLLEEMLVISPAKPPE